MTRIILLLILLTSCLQPRIPADSRKAEKQARLYDTRLQSRHPQLARFDTVKIVKHDTIRIDSVVNSIEYRDVINTQLVDSLLRQINAPESVRETIIRQVNKDTTFVYEDSVIRLKTSIRKGNVNIDYTVKEKEIRYETLVVERPKIQYVENTPLWKEILSWISIIFFILMILYIILKNRR